MLERINELEKQAKGILKEVNEIKEKAKVVTLGSLNPGDVFKIGEKDFIVLEHVNGQTKVISKLFWGGDKQFGQNKNYASSSLREFIEKEIYPKIAAVVGEENIVEHEVDLTAIDGGNDFGKLSLKVHQIEFMEARKYFSLLINKKLPNWWWTITPWNSGNHGYSNCVAVFSPSGNFDCVSYFSSHGVRPFCILKSNIFVSRR